MASVKALSLKSTLVFEDLTAGFNSASVYSNKRPNCWCKIMCQDHVTTHLGVNSKSYSALENHQNITFNALCNSMRQPISPCHLHSQIIKFLCRQELFELHLKNAKIQQLPFEVKTKKYISLPKARVCHFMTVTS